MASAGFAQLAVKAPKIKSIPIDGYAAKVDNQIITKGEVHEMIAPMLPRLARRFQGQALEAELEKAYEQALEQLIERKLIEAAFKASGGQIPEYYIEEEVRRTIRTRFKGDKALFEQLLAEQKITRKDYQETVRNQIIVNMMMAEEVNKRIRVTPAEVRAAYETNLERYTVPAKVKYSVILLNKGSSPEDQKIKLQEAENILNRLRNGADFADTARKISEGARASDGGEFPWMQPKDARKEIQELLTTLATGSISEVVETAREFLIVKLDAVRRESVQPFEKVRKDLKTELEAKERERLRKRWMERLKKEHYILIYK